MSEAVEGRPVTGGRMLGLVLGAVLVTNVGQQVLTPVLAPLSREMGLSEVQLGLVITLSAAVFALGSLGWGRVADRWGNRRVLLTGLLLGVAGLSGFAAVCQWAVAGDQPSGWVMAGMILTRSLLFGLGLGAVPVAALAYVSSVTSGEQERTRAVSLVGASQAIALALGPALGGVLAFVQLLLPLYVAPLLLLALAAVIAIALPRPPRVTGAAPAAPPRSLSPFDPRVRPFLGVGFLLFVALGSLQVVLGFLLQDRLVLDSRATAGTVGAVFFAVGIALILVQGVVVPRLGWGPARLLRTGSPIAAAGFVGLVFAPEFWTITVALVVIATGLGLAMPGFTAGPGLRVGDGEQGAVAGLVNATTGATFVVGPLLGTSLYGAGQTLPIWFGALSCLVAAVVAIASRGIATTPAAPVGTAPGAAPAAEPVVGDGDAPR